MADPEENPKDLRDLTFLMRGFQVSKMIEVAASLGLADRIGDQPRPAADLALECGAIAEMLLRLCSALAAFGVFTIDPEGNVGHSRLSRGLRTDANPTLHYAARFMLLSSNWAAWGALESTIRTGQAAFEAVHGMANFTYLKQNPAAAAIFDSFMQHSPDDRHAAVTEAYDFSDAGTVIDIGGGNGALLAAILGANPDTSGVLFDQEAVVAGAPAALGVLMDRCTVSAGNFFDAVPSGGDIYTMSQILHDWSDERCLVLLQNCRHAMKPDGRLLVIERVLEPDPGTNPLNHLSDMQMMVLFPGAKERTVAEFTALLQQAGFAPPRVIATRSAFSIIETRPAS